MTEEMNWQMHHHREELFEWLIDLYYCESKNTNSLFQKNKDYQQTIFVFVEWYCLAKLCFQWAIELLSQADYILEISMQLSNWEKKKTNIWFCFIERMHFVYIWLSKTCVQKYHRFRKLIGQIQIFTLFHWVFTVCLKFISKLCSIDLYGSFGCIWFNWCFMIFEFSIIFILQINKQKCKEHILFFEHTKCNVCKCSTGVKPGFGTDSILHWSTGMVSSLISDGGSSSSISDCLSKCAWWLVRFIVEFLFVFVVVDTFFRLNICINFFRMRFRLNFCFVLLLNSKSLSSSSEFNSSS